MKRFLIALSVVMSCICLADANDVFKAIVLKDSNVWFDIDQASLRKAPLAAEFDKLEKAGQEQFIKNVNNLKPDKAAENKRALEMLTACAKALGIDNKEKVDRFAIAGCVNTLEKNAGKDLGDAKLCAAWQLVELLTVEQIKTNLEKCMEELGKSNLKMEIVTIGTHKMLKVIAEGENANEEATEITFFICVVEDAKCMLLADEKVITDVLERLDKKAFFPLDAAMLEIRASLPEKHFMELLVKLPEEAMSGLSEKAATTMATNPMLANVMFNLANLKGFAFSGYLSEKGAEYALMGILDSPENAIAFKSVLLDGMVKPMLTMMVVNYAGQNLSCIENMEALLNEKATGLKTTITKADLELLLKN